MRKILLAFMSTVAAVVMLFGYRTSTPVPGGTATAAVATGSGAGATPTGTGGAATPTGGATTTAAAGSTGSKTVTGATAQTRWGPVQVQIVVAAGKVTAVTALQVPSSNGRDVEINSYAVPVLTQETLQAQSAGIDTVSGATYTSQGYISSLQSALDRAGL